MLFFQVNNLSRCRVILRPRLRRSFAMTNRIPFKHKPCGNDVNAELASVFSCCSPDYSEDSTFVWSDVTLTSFRFRFSRIRESMKRHSFDKNLKLIIQCIWNLLNVNWDVFLVLSHSENFKCQEFLVVFLTLSIKLIPMSLQVNSSSLITTIVFKFKSVKQHISCFKRPRFTLLICVG